MMTSPANPLDDALDSLEAELASFSKPHSRDQAEQTDRNQPSDVPPVANDDLPNPATHFVIAAYRAC